MMDSLSDCENHNYYPNETEAPKTETIAFQVKEKTKSPTAITCKVITYLYLLVISYQYLLNE